MSEDGVVVASVQPIKTGTGFHAPPCREVGPRFQLAEGDRGLAHDGAEHPISPPPQYVDQ